MNLSYIGRLGPAFRMVHTNPGPYPPRLVGVIIANMNAHKRGHY